ncbi:mycobactin biosynthesis salicylate synthase MbtI [Amycolatopsis endophytica]|uniref:Salicylate synthase n=1 Tax=Amycolatopsis endophytica TaxID=860233 RepID=A0A853BDC6_9PSEU|nr:salicylate synthase [Amycolatopsis endophytica]NYI93373.1 salicylate synthase [Amycolatopsis endophytica]
MRRVIPFAGDALAAGAVLCASAAGEYLFYEDAEGVSLAEGELARVEVYRDRVSLVNSGSRRDFPVHGTPLATAGSVLREVGGRAYGWVAFELCLDSAGGELARFLLPRREIRISGGEATLHAATVAELDDLERRLGDTTATPLPGERIEVDTRDHGAAAYEKSVLAALDEIHAGNLDKVILSRSVPVPGDLDLPATYLAGRRANDPARSFLLRLGGWEAAGFSPEIVARVTASGTVTTQPLAGTRALTGDEDRDAAALAELLRDPKEVFEHAVSVRLAAAELDGLCEPGTVRVTEFMDVRRRGSVQHLASRVMGDLRAGVGAWDALTGLFPAVTASGIPKAQACELLHRLEPGERGLYSGAIVVADSDGALDAALVLRSLFRHRGETWLRAGAGVVGPSTPARELEETREKLAAVSRYLVPAAESLRAAS